MRSARYIIAGLCAVVMALALTSCEREQRQFRAPPAARGRAVTLSELHLGLPHPEDATPHPYERNAYALAEGQRLFTWFNCAGCHAHGGGGIGPALIDSLWIYGGQPENIFASIVEGRPNGMPSFRGKIPADQVWKIVAYVRSLRGLVPKDAAPGRRDHMHVKKPEQAVPLGPPKPSE